MRKQCQPHPPNSRSSSPTVILASPLLLHRFPDNLAPYLLNDAVELLITQYILDELDWLDKERRQISHSKKDRFRRKLSPGQSADKDDSASKSSMAVYLTGHLAAEKTIRWGQFEDTVRTKGSTYAELQVLPRSDKVGRVRSDAAAVRRLPAEVNVVVMCLDGSYANELASQLSRDRVEFIQPSSPSTERSWRQWQILEEQLRRCLQLQIYRQPGDAPTTGRTRDLESSSNPSRFQIEAFVDTGHLPGASGVEGRLPLGGAYRAGTLPAPVTTAISRTCEWELHNAQHASTNRTRPSPPSAAPTNPTPAPYLWPAGQTPFSAEKDPGLRFVGQVNPLLDKPPTSEYLADAVIALDFRNFVKELDPGKVGKVAVGITADRVMSLRMRHVADEFGKANEHLDGPPRVLSLWVQKEGGWGKALYRTPLQGCKQVKAKRGALVADPGRANLWAGALAWYADGGHKKP